MFNNVEELFKIEGFSSITNYYEEDEDLFNEYQEEDLIEFFKALINGMYKENQQDPFIEKVGNSG
jgi:hypothetical protein